MKNAIKLIGIIALVSGIGFFLVSCGDGGNPPQEGKVFFQSLNNGVQQNARNLSENKVEFLVSNLLLVRDDASTNGWLIGNFDAGGPKINNIGWFDIAGLNRTTVKTPLNNAPHSCIRLSIKAIRLNDELIFGEDLSFNNEKQFDIVAGDLSKLGKHEYINNGTPNIPFIGVTGLSQVDEFIIFVDESKLHTNGILADDWWKCFSFSVK